jgi:HlyD family secretion protein
MSTLKKNWRWVAILAVICAAGAFFFVLNGADGARPGNGYESAVADHGSISQTVATSGAVRPLVTVQVGSQLSGQVAELFADFNSEVTKGALIARIDPQTFKTRVEGARAELAVAEANLTARRADTRRAEAMLAQRKSDLDRYEGLTGEAGISEIEMDSFRAQYEAARADYDGAKAQVTNAEASVMQRKASLDQAEVDLARTEIRSPINGVVISRNVDVGQTVAASMSAPILFEIAQDLSLIQIEADVNEADIGAVSKGDQVSFSVDAYPGRDFSGVVEMVRLAPIELQNVVTYKVIIHADNPARMLFPGMTATVQIITGQRENALRIPNTAARFEPSNAEELRAQANMGRQRGEGAGGGMMDELVATLELSQEQQNRLQAEMRELFAAGGGGGGAAGGFGGFGGVDPAERQKRMNAIMKKILTVEQWAAFQAGQQDRPQPKIIWVLSEGGTIEPRRILLGIADGSYTEVTGGDLAPGDAVVTRELVSRS